MSFLLLIYLWLRNSMIELYEGDLIYTLCLIKMLCNQRTIKLTVD